MDLRWLMAPAALICAAAPAEAASVAEWRATIDEVVRDVRVNHPDPFTKVGELTFLREADALKAALPALTEEQRLVRLMRLVASIGDGHTQIASADPAFAYWYPIRLYEFTDGIFITAAHQSVRELAGAQVLEIGGRPVAEVASAARDLRGSDNAFDRLQHLEAAHNAAVMQGLGYADAARRLHVRARLRSGRIVERTLIPMATNHPFYSASENAFGWAGSGEVYGPPGAPFEEWVSAYGNLPAMAFRTADPSRPAHLIYRRLQIAQAYPEQDAFYIQVNAVAPEQMLPFLREQLALIDQERPRRLILDIRYNQGGDGSRMTEIVQLFTQRLADPPWREFYLVTGRRTFSAGVMMADAFIKALPLTVVGEPAGAGFNSYGDAGEHRFETPRLSLYVSTLRHDLSASNDLREIIPVDVPAPMSFADYIAGRDPAVDPILAGAEMRSIPAIARSDGGAAARTAYEARRARFANLDWWRPPTEIEMRAACDGLREADRMDDALAACALTTDMHPYVWNSWYNLAMVQNVRGEQAARIRSLNCVLALDANNFNRQEIEEARASAGGDTSVAPGCPAG